MKNKNIIIAGLIFVLSLATYYFIFFKQRPETTENLSPIAHAGLDRSVILDENIIFDGSASIDPDGTIVSYIWNFGDGSTKTGKIVTHAFKKGGNYTVTLTVADDDGAVGTAIKIMLVVSKIEYPRPLTIEDLDEHPEKRDNRENYWFTGNVEGDDGFRYVFNTRTQVGGQAGLNLHRLGTSSVHSESFFGRTYVDLVENEVNVVNNNWKLSLTPSIYKLEVDGQKVAFDLTFNAVGYPFFYSKGEKAEMAPGLWGWGYEVFTEIDGTMIIQGQAVKVHGKGGFEHFWGNISWGHVTEENWIPVHFEDVEIFLWRVDRTDGTAYEDGIIYQVSKDEYLIVNHVEVEVLNENGDISILAETEEGAVISLLGISLVQVNPGHWVLSFSGKLEIDEREIILENGEGWRESVTKTVS